MSPTTSEVFTLHGGARLEYWPHWLDLDAASALVKTLAGSAPWEQRVMRLGGRAVPQPRLTAWYGERAYTYSGVTHEPAPWLPELADLRARLWTLTGHRFNSVLLNLYRCGADSVGMHADNERGLGPDPVIASVSLGATRTFKMQHATDRREKFSLALAHGSLLVMGRGVQAQWRHGIPKTTASVGMRINLTFREMVE